MVNPWVNQYGLLNNENGVQPGLDRTIKGKTGRIEAIYAVDIRGLARVNPGLAGSLEPPW